MRSSALALLTAAFVLGGVAQAGAVTLLVNGDTPSKRWQRRIERSRVPLPRGRVTLLLAPCPDTFDEGVASACVRMDPRQPTIWLDPRKGDARTMTISLFFELGRIFAMRYLSDSDRERFRTIWGRPAIPWDAPLEEFREPDPETDAPWVGADGRRGIESTAHAWFADAYQVCARFRVPSPDGPGGLSGVVQWLPEPEDFTGQPGSDYSTQVAFERRLAASCRLIRRAASAAR